MQSHHLINGKEVQQENILSRDIDNHKERIILNEKLSDCKKYPSGKANMMWWCYTWHLTDVKSQNIF